MFAVKKMNKKRNIYCSKNEKRMFAAQRLKRMFSFKSELLIKIVLDGYWKLSSGKKLEQKALTQRLHFQSNSSLQPLNSKTQTPNSKKIKLQKLKLQTQKNSQILKLKKLKTPKN